MEGYQGLPAYYSQTSDPTTPNLGLALKAMDPIVAENFVIIDTAYGSGSSIEVNGVVVPAPANFINSASVTLSVLGSNISLTSAGGGTPGGSSGDIQYNNSGVFGGSAATITSGGSITIPDGQEVNDPLGNFLGFATTGITLEDTAGNTISLNVGSVHLIPSIHITDSTGDTIILTNNLITIRDSAGDIITLGAGVAQFSVALTELEAISVNSISNSGAYDDSTTSPGTSGQVLSSTVTGTLWISASSLSVAWSSLTGHLSSGQVIPYADTGISRLAAGVLAIGDGANGDLSGTLALTYLSLDHEGAVEWSSASTGAIDTAFYRVSAGTVALGDGAAQDISGTLQLSNLLHDYVGVESWASASTATIDTGISRISAGLLGIGTGAQGSIAGSLSLANATYTSVNATPGTASSTAGFVLLQNTTPTVTGSATTLAISAVSTTSGVSTYTIASTTGAGSNGWKGASITVAGFSGANAGNNGTFIVTASTTTTVVVNNASGTSAGTGTMITSAVVNSPILQIAGTVNTGTSGTLNSVADVWSIQNVLGSVAPNPTSTLTITHSGTTGTAYVSMPGLSISSAVATFNVSSDILFDIGSSPLWEILSTTLRGGSGQNLSWSSSATANGATQDTTISRNAAGIVQVGTTSANASGNLAASSFAANGVVASPTAGIYYSGGTAGVSAGPFSAITSIQTIGGIVTTLADVSDERLKDHSPYLGGLQEILGITPIKYRWNQAGQKITGFDDTSSFVGFSAQDVQRTIPEAVRGSASNPEYLGFSDRPVIAALVNAIKDLHAIIKKQDERIEQLEEKLDSKK